VRFEGRFQAGSGFRGTRGIDKDKDKVGSCQNEIFSLKAQCRKRRSDTGTSVHIQLTV
jgi:hypothetical protein